MEAKRLHTVWGWADSIVKYADGIQRISTSSHGGFKLDRKRNAQVHKAWRRKGGWYEEDCEYAIVVLTFPECFDSAIIRVAEASAKNYYPHEYALVFGVTVTLEESRKLRKEVFEKETQDKLVAVCAWGSWYPGVPDGMVVVEATLGGNRGTKGDRFLIPADDYQPREFGFIVDPKKYERFTGLFGMSAR